MPTQPLNPGRLDTPITLRQWVHVEDAVGGVSDGFTTGDTVFAQWIPDVGGEDFSSDARVSRLRGRFRIRYRSDINARWQVLRGTQVFDLTAPPEEVGRRSYLDLPVQSSPAAADERTVQMFTVNLDANDVTKVITFPVAFSSAPRGFKLQLIVPPGGFSFGVEVVDGTVATTGFTAQFGASVPDAGYKLNIIVIQ